MLKTGIVTLLVVLISVAVSPVDLDSADQKLMEVCFIAVFTASFDIEYFNLVVESQDYLVEKDYFWILLNGMFWYGLFGRFMNCLRV